MSLLAHVTPSLITCDTSTIDFGYVSIFESAVKTIKLVNNSALAQKLGFVDLPGHISVQPGDGFATILPFESITLDVIFRFADDTIFCV